LTSAAGNNGDAQGQYSLQGTALNGTFNLTTNAATTTAAITAPVVSLESNATFNVAAGNVMGGATPGVDVLVSSVLRNYTGAGGTVVPLTKMGAGVMKLTGVNTYTGATTVANGKLALGVANSINTTASVTLGDAVNSTSGTLVTGGFVQSVAGTLGLATSGHIDLGLGGQPGGGAVHFGASNGLWGASTLAIDNWTPGIDHLFFGSNNTGLDPSQVSDITFANFGAAQITATGEIIPVAAVPTFVLSDVDGDGHFNVADISAEMAALTNISAFQSNYGPSHLVLNNDELYAVLDQNHEGMINNLDVQAAITALANTGGVGTLTAVPEPTSFVLLAVGGVLVYAGARTRRNAAAA
jgi:autotransporter-associated beta strand protein